ncbi:hypothetical protein Q3V30_22355 (plasmid) [Erwinia pyri]|uniref:Uncharacterized protein n=1 Tax=Erwinia pyri TaxID=3062598 RepID=A0AA50DNW9_9GAMM|nr:hypothetical protein [Erwinia sp. DE2]WLS81207.1 hypothetical protein Q3V30_22355 [Erwinia sp. DE2]
MKKFDVLIIAFGFISHFAYSNDLSASDEAAVEVGQFLSMPGVAVELGAVPGHEGAIAPLMLGAARKFNDQAKAHGVNCEQAGQTYGSLMSKMNDENPTPHGGILVRLLSAYQLADCKERI